MEKNIQELTEKSFVKMFIIIMPYPQTAFLTLSGRL